MSWAVLGKWISIHKIIGCLCQVGRAGTRWYVVIGYISRSAGWLCSDASHLIHECSSSAVLSASRHKQRPEITSPGELRDFLPLIWREMFFFCKATLLNGKFRFGCWTASSSAGSLSSSRAGFCCSRGAEMDRGAWRHSTALFGNTVYLYNAYSCWSFATFVSGLTGHAHLQCPLCGIMVGYVYLEYTWSLVCLLVFTWWHNIGFIWHDGILKECRCSCYPVRTSPNGIKPAVVVKVHRSSTWVKVQIRILKYYSSKSKSTAFSILLEWKYKSTQFFMYLSKKVLIDRFILQFYIDYFI